MLSFGHVHSVRSFIMIPSHDVVDIVDSSWSQPYFGEISGPNTSVGILGLILGEIGRVNMVMDVAISFIPFLIVILFEMVMGWMDCEILSHPGSQFQLLVYFVQQQVILFADHAVTVGAVS